jgi:hypothetical protein
MGFMFVVGDCINCHAPLCFNPDCVPSLRIDGVKQPLCESCFDKWNELHRTSKGLPPLPLHPDAYKAAPAP